MEKNDEGPAADAGRDFQRQRENAGDLRPAGCLEKSGIAGAGL